MKQGFFILTCFFFTLFSCNTTEYNYETEEVDAFMLSNYIFNIGTYWVYKEINSSQIDCVYVKNIEELSYKWEIGSQSKPNERNVITTKMIKDSLSENPIIKYIWLQRSGISFEINPTQDANHSNSLSSQFYWITNGNIGFSYDNSEYVDSMEIQSNMYYGIYKLTDLIRENNSSMNYDTVNYYIKGKTGLLSKEIISHTGETIKYDLIRYEIK